MKRFAVAILAIAMGFSSGPLGAQDQLGAPGVIDASIQRAQSEYDAIQQGIGGYRTVQREFTSDEGYGVLTAYLDADSVRKLVVQLAKSSKGSVTEYFYWKNDLIYILDASESFAAPYQGQDAPTLVKESRYWFDKSKLVRWSESAVGLDSPSVEVSPSEPGFATRGSTLVQQAELWKAFARSDATDFSRFSEDGSGVRSGQ